MDLACVAWRRIWNSFFLLASCGQLRQSSTRFSNFNSTLQYTIQGDSGLGRQLADALSTLHRLPSPKLQELLPDTISALLAGDFLWRHDEIQRELDKLVVKDPDDLYDLSRIPTKKLCSQRTHRYFS